MSVDMFAFLSTKSVDSILSTHPNRLFSSAGCGTIPSAWASWWAWAGDVEGPADNVGRTHTVDAAEPKWLLVMRYYSQKKEDNDSAWLSIPDEVQSLVDAARRMQVSREMDEIALHAPTLDMQSRRGLSNMSVASEERILGMSPKKAHEILRMSAYLSKLLATSPEIVKIEHAVDVGAGQAYLSRAMRDRLGLDVLALDWSDVQSKGAARRETMGPKKRKKALEHPTKPCDVTLDVANEDIRPRAQTHESYGSLAYKILEIRSDSLLRAVDEWSEEMRTPRLSGCSPLPMLFVALHACGSLTPNIL
ncbi:hypothetical protein FOMPIDRAFT_1051305, partial [Fomitopsis schrenkii]